MTCRALSFTPPPHHDRAPGRDAVRRHDLHDVRARVEARDVDGSGAAPAVVVTIAHDAAQTVDEPDGDLLRRKLDDDPLRSRHRSYRERRGRRASALVADRDGAVVAKEAA